MPSLSPPNAPMSPCPRQTFTKIYFLDEKSQWICLFWTFHVNGIRDHMVLCICILSFTMMLFYLFFWGGVFLGPHPLAHGGSQARGRIGAVAAHLHHSRETRDPSHVCNLHHSSWQRWILNSLSKARGRTCILMDAFQICFHRATVGTKHYCFLKIVVTYI